MLYNSRAAFHAPQGNGKAERRQILHGRDAISVRPLNWRGTPSGCSLSRNRAKNAACSISFYRTAHGRMAKWLRPSVNRLTCLRKQRLLPRVARRTRRPNRRKMRFGCPSWIHIEPCALPLSPSFGALWRKSGLGPERGALARNWAVLSVPELRISSFLLTSAPPPTADE